MNKVYKVIWSEVSETFVSVPEVVRGASKSSSASPHAPHKTVRPGHAHFFIKSLVAALICIGFTFAIHAAPLSAQLAPASANQLPTGAQVSAGSATVSQSGSVLTLKQTTPKAAVNWQTFNVGAQAQVDIVQPSSSSVLLNRVLDSNPSQIFGKINANGQVFLENPNGVYFAPSASVDTGSFLATTSNISDADFMAGNYRFDRNGATGTIVNQGKITSTLGGYIALLAPEVRNAGVVVARGGTIVLAAGETYQLQFESNNTLTNILVSPSTVAAYIENGNAVQAPGGLIILSAQAANAIQGGGDQKHRLHHRRCVDQRWWCDPLGRQQQHQPLGHDQRGCLALRLRQWRTDLTRGGFGQPPKSNPRCWIDQRHGRWAGGERGVH